MITSSTVGVQGWRGDRRGVLCDECSRTCFFERFRLSETDLEEGRFLYICQCRYHLQPETCATRESQVWQGGGERGGREGAGRKGGEGGRGGNENPLDAMGIFFNFALKIYRLKCPLSFTVHDYGVFNWWDCGDRMCLHSIPEVRTGPVAIRWYTSTTTDVCTFGFSTLT